MGCAARSPTSERSGGSSWRRWTRRSRSTWRRSSTSGSTPKHSTSASSPSVLAALDLRLLRLLRTRGHWPPFERAVQTYAMAGENGLLWHCIAAAGVACHSERRPVYVRAMRITVVTLVVNTTVKRLVRRARPVMEAELPALVPTLSGRSYPSAHSSTSFAAAGAPAPPPPAPP